MTTHESVRERLPLAAAGALESDEMLQVSRHMQVCEECRVELESWAVYASGLRQLPQPVLPSHLVARTQARILREHASATESRTSALAFGALGVFSWMSAISFWLIVRTITGGTFELFGTNLVSAGPWFLLSFVTGSITAVVAAFVLRDYSRIRRIS